MQTAPLSAFIFYVFTGGQRPSFKHLPLVWTRVHETDVTGDMRRSIFADGAEPHLTSCAAKLVSSELVWNVLLSEEIRGQERNSYHTIGGGDVCKIPHHWKERRVGTLKVHFSSAQLSFLQTGRTLESAPCTKKKLKMKRIPPSALSLASRGDVITMTRVQTTSLSVWMALFPRDCGLYAPLTLRHPSSVSLLSGLIIRH